jgi:hypothetical protein
MTDPELQALKTLHEAGYEIVIKPKRPEDAPLRLCDVRLRPGDKFKVRRNGQEYMVLDTRDQYGYTNLWCFTDRRTTSNIHSLTEIEVTHKGELLCAAK